MTRQRKPKKRSSYGSGSVWQLPSGKWQGALFLGKVDGKTKRHYVTGETEREVREKLQELAVKYRSGDLVATADKHTVASYLDMWLEQVVMPQHKPRTYESWRDNTRLHIKPHIGTTRLDQVTAQQIQALLNTLAQKYNRVPGMVRTILHAACAQAVAWGLLPKNPASNTKTPRTTRREIAPLSVEEAERLLDVVTGHRLEALYRVAIGLGLRRGEILGLLWSDVNLKTQTLRIRDGKTAKSSTTMPIPNALVEVLKEHWDLQQQERLQPDWQEQGLVFPSSVGTPLQKTTLYRHFKAALKRAKLPPSIRFHDLRHSCATILLAQGVDLRTVQEVLRHTNITMTARYAHVLDQGRRAALEGLGDIVGKRKKTTESDRKEGT